MPVLFKNGFPRMTSSAISQTKNSVLYSKCEFSCIIEKLIRHIDASSLLFVLANAIFLCLSVISRCSLYRFDITLQFAPVSSNALINNGGSLGFLLDTKISWRVRPSVKFDIRISKQEPSTSQKSDRSASVSASKSAA